jgi:carbonic anhydrase
MTPATHVTAIRPRASERALDALALLVEGNRRFREGTMEERDRQGFLGSEAAQEQQPFAAVLGCSDSRVPPQLVFDQGPGDLFTARVAGHVATDEVVATLEYAVSQLDVPLVLVLGHSRCGAVTACLHGGEGPPVGKLGTLLQHIEPAVRRARQEEGDQLEHAIHFHVEHVVKQLRSSEPILRPRYEAGTLAIVGATYDLDTGAVRIVDAGTLDPVL